MGIDQLRKRFHFPISLFGINGVKPSMGPKYAGLSIFGVSFSEYTYWCIFSSYQHVRVAILSLIWWIARFFYVLARIMFPGPSMIRKAAKNSSGFLADQPAFLPRYFPLKRAKPAVLMTGCSTGIGAYSALRMATYEGYTVFAGCRRIEDGERLVRAFQDEISKSHFGSKECVGRIVPIILDVCSTRSIEFAYDTISQYLRDSWEPDSNSSKEEEIPKSGLELVALINNAGVAPMSPSELLPVNQLAMCLKTNLMGPIALTNKFLPLLRRTKEGASARVILIGSMSGTVSTPFMSAYCASKFGLEGWADAIRGELASQGIAVSVIKPGAIKTPLFDKADKWTNAGLKQELDSAQGSSFSSRKSTIVDAAKSERTFLPRDTQSSIYLPALDDHVSILSQDSVSMEMDILKCDSTPSWKNIVDPYAELTTLYSNGIEKSLIMRDSLRDRAIPPFFVYLSIIDACKSEFPQSRYWVGVDSWAMEIVRKWLPDVTWDWLFWWLVEISCIGQKLMLKSAHLLKDFKQKVN